MSTSNQRSTAQPTPSESTQTRRHSLDDGSRGSVKIAQPDLYHGERKKLEEWLMQVQLYLRFYDTVPAKQHTAVAITFMRGDAQKWVQPHLQKYLDDPSDVPDVAKWMESFAYFKAELRKIFAPSNEVNQAVRVIQHIKQKRSAAEYTTQFQQYAVKTEWDDDALMTMYRRGLKENVKDELMRTGASLDTLDELQKEAIQIDDNLFERAMEKRHDGGVSGAGASRYQFARNFATNHGKKSSDPYGPMPMEIDMMKKTVHGKPRKGTSKKALKCYGCGKLGHFARDCRSKNMVSRPQINMMRRVPIKEEGTRGTSKPSPKWDDPKLNQMLENQHNWSEQAIAHRIEELEMADDEAWNDSMTMSDQWEHYLQGFSYETWDSDLPPAITGIENSEQYDRYYNRFQELRNERLGLDQDGKAQDEQEDDQEDDSEWERVTLNEELEPGSNPPTNLRDTLDGQKPVHEYRNDSWHPQHGTTHWSRCADRDCHHHKTARREAQGKVYEPPCYHYDFSKCPDDECPWHLYAKRATLRFYGWSDDWHRRLVNEVRNRYNKEDCDHWKWETCLVPNCTIHMNEKIRAGFHPSQEVNPEKENSGKD